MTHNQVQWHLGNRTADIRSSELEETKSVNEYNKKQNERAQAQSAASMITTAVLTFVMIVCMF